MTPIGKRSAAALTVALAVMMITMVPASSTSMTIDAEADAFVVAARPSTNRDDSNSLRVRGDTKISYLRFDVPFVPADEQVARATLELFAVSRSGCGVQVLRVATRAWNEATIDWSNQPGPVGEVIATRTWRSRGSVSFDVTSAVTGGGPVSLALRHVPGCDPGSSELFASREAGKNQPQLVVQTGSPAPEGATILAAAGDIVCDPTSANFVGADTAGCQHRATSALLSGADAVVPLGDLQYDAGTLDEFNVGYDPSWGLYAAMTYPVPGNHEYEIAGAPGYFDYWASEQRPTGEAASGYYSFDLGSWHLIALNSVSGCCEEGSAQDDFLEQDLAATTQRCIAAYWHHPLFNSGTVHGDESFTRPLWDDLYAAGADIVLNGHEHNYQRYAKQDPLGVPAPTGIREFIVGTGGKGHYGLLEIKDANYEFGNTTDFGVLRLQLFEDSYSWEFVGVDGAVLDSGGPVPCN